MNQETDLEHTLDRASAHAFKWDNRANSLRCLVARYEVEGGPAALARIAELRVEIAAADLEAAAAHVILGGFR